MRSGFDPGLSLCRPCEAMATVRALQFDQGMPQFSGEPELFDEYLDRVVTLVIGWTDEVVKKSGPLGPRLYNALKGEAYTAVKATNIAKADLAKKEGVELMIAALKSCIRGIGPTRAGEIFDRYFDGGARKRSLVDNEERGETAVDVSRPQDRGER